MAASLNDSAVLSTNALYQGRVRESLAFQCANIASEAITTASLVLHNMRMRLVVQIMASIEISSGNQSAWVSRFAIITATNASVLADATQAGTVVLTVANCDAQQALISDTNLNNAVASQINTFLQPV